MLKRILLCIFCLSVLAAAQGYLEASGRTAAFTLAAGAKAAWQPPLAVEQTRIVAAVLPVLNFSPNPVYGDLWVSLAPAQGKTTLVLHDLSGRKIVSFDLSHKSRAAIHLDLPNGLYLARLLRDGRMVASSRLLVVR